MPKNILHINKKCIYKYMTYQNALKMLQNDELYFSNPECWDDPLESYLLCRQYITSSGKWDYPLKDRIGICCFTQTAANEAQWKVYANPQQDVIVQIEFDYMKLLDVISRNLPSMMHIVDNNIYCDEVEYVTRDKFLERNKRILASKGFKNAFYEVNKGIYQNLVHLLRPFVLKSSAYSYENELRFIIVLDDYLCKKGYILKVVDLKSAITKISISSQNENLHPLNVIKNNLEQQVQGLGITVCINSIFHRPTKRQDIKI